MAFDSSNVQPTGNSEVDSARGEALLLAQAVEVEVIVTPRRDKGCSGIWDVGVSRKVFEIPCLGYTRSMKEQTDPGYCRRSFSSFVILDCFSSHPTKMQAARSSFVSPLEAPPLCSGSFCGRTRKDD